MTSASPLEIARRQIEFAREYTLSLLEDIEPAQWFTIPEGCVTHTAWQVGHLGMAEYGLCLFRQRGRQPIDTEIMTREFRKQFSKGTQPNPDPAANPTPEEIRAIFDRVHQQALDEFSSFDGPALEEKIDMPYAGYDTKLGALLFCSHHEMLHAGQLGLLRRLLGKQPVR